MSLLITHGRAFVRGRLESVNILVEEGRIARLSKGRISQVDESVNARGLVVLPGMIDGHVHMREPGLTSKEDFRTGSMAAAHGGITSFIDMPNTKPPTFTKRLLEEKAGLARKSIVNYGFHMGTNGRNTRSISLMVKNSRNDEMPFASVKVYMNETTGMLKISSPELIRRVFNSSQRIAVHAEGEKVHEAIELSKEKGNMLYLCHLSLAEELRMVEEAKKKNKVYAEVTPHHLFLKRRKGDILRLMKPELKSEKERIALWQGLKRGVIDTIGTDHAPHTIEDKENGAFGVPGVETALPLMLNAVSRGIIRISDAVRLYSRNPALIWGLRKKGEIRRGFDADLVLVDMKREKRVNNEELLTKAGWSPFEGARLKGWPVMTIVNGAIVYEEGNIYLNRGRRLLFKWG